MLNYINYLVFFVDFLSLLKNICKVSKFKLCCKYDTLLSYFIIRKNKLLEFMICKIFKNISFIITFFLYLTTSSLSEVTSKAWSTQCSEDKKACIAVIINEIKNKDKMQTLATAYFQIGSASQKKMNLVNEEDQTYKLSEESKNIPVLFIKLPLNVDLSKKPAIIIDNKKLGNLNFSHCNQNDGCVTNLVVNNDVIDLFKKGKTMSVITGIYGNAKNVKIEFPLKNFTKSYAKIIKE